MAYLSLHPGSLCEPHKPFLFGKENFNWWMKHVWLYPETWEECMNTALREYQRAVAFLKLEENKNRKHPQLPYVVTERGHAQLWNQAEDYLTRFIRKNEIFTVPDYLTPSGPHRPWVASSDRDGECAEFFEQAERHDPMAQVAHNHTGHHLDHLRHQREDRPIRNAYPLFGGLRTEALPMFMEEGTMIAGLHDEWALNPRSREVIYVSLAWRATCAMQLGDGFNLREFMDSFFASGMIPISLARWEVTGLNDEIKKLQLSRTERNP